MKTIIAIAASLVLAGAAYGQGRHDEKPHGSGKPAAASKERGSVEGVSGGRHDERPHGPKKKAKPKAVECAAKDVK